MTADITLRGPGDVLTVLPYQLGYQPRDSIVVVSLRGRRVGLVARADLPDDDRVEAAVAQLVGPLVRDGATSVIAIGYEDERDASQPALVALVERVEAGGIGVVEVAVVRDGRRYSPTCSEPCCPPEGVELPQPADVPAVAEYVARGRSPLASRRDVDALVAPDPLRTAGVADAVTARAALPRRRRRSAAAWRVVLRRGGMPTGGRAGGRGDVTPSARVVADAVLGLSDIAWRDGLIAWLVPGVLPVGLLDRRVLLLLRAELPSWAGTGPGAAGWMENPSTGRGFDAHRVAQERAELLQRLLVLCRSVPDACPDEAAGVCTLTAHVAWVEGDGAVARAGVDRALRLAPGYRLAQLLATLVDEGVRLPVTGGGDGPATARVG